MAQLLGELLPQLISKDGNEKMTKEETAFFLNWKATTLRSSVLVGSIATGVVFAATRKLNIMNRFSLAGGAGFITGYWRIKESAKTCVDQILGLDGTRMQHELKKIVLQKYGDDPRRMQKFSKHFYGEEVYSDSNPEYPKLVYRLRHVSMENQKVANENRYDVSDADGLQQNHLQKSSDHNPSNLKVPNMDSKHVQVNPGISVYGYGDPLEVLFDYALANDEVDESPGASGDATKGYGRSQKRLRRRQRMRQRHREALSLGDAQLLTA